MRWWKSKSGRQKLMIAAVVLAIVAVGGVVAAQPFASDEPVRPRSTGADRENPADAKPSGKPLELGTVARISSNYRVAVTELTLYTAARAQLMVVTVKAKYIGKEEGEPWGDLTAKYIGPDSRTSGEAACPFDLGDLDASDQATLATDDETTYGVCLDLPAGKVDGGRVYVEEAFSNDDPISWSTDEVVTKPLPAPPRSSSPQRAPGTQPQQSDNDDSSGNNAMCDEDYDEDIEEYREGIDDLDKLAEQADEDDQEEYEEWKDGMEKNIEQYEKYC